MRTLVPNNLLIQMPTLIVRSSMCHRGPFRTEGANQSQPTGAAVVHSFPVSSVLIHLQYPVSWVAMCRAFSNVIHTHTWVHFGRTCSLAVWHVMKKTAS